MHFVIRQNIIDKLCEDFINFKIKYEQLKKQKYFDKSKLSNLKGTIDVYDFVLNSYEFKSNKPYKQRTKWQWVPVDFLNDIIHKRNRLKSSILDSDLSLTEHTNYIKGEIEGYSKILEDIHYTEEI